MEDSPVNCRCVKLMMTAENFLISMLLRREPVGLDRLAVGNASHAGRFSFAGKDAKPLWLLERELMCCY